MAAAAAAAAAAARLKGTKREKRRVGGTMTVAFGKTVSGDGSGIN